MMMNLFTVFDPVSMFGISLNWVVPLVIFLFAPLSLWLYKNRYGFLSKRMFYILNKEISLNMSGVNVFCTFLCVNVFFAIFGSNFMGLFSYVFTISSHLCYTLSLALPMWLGVVMLNCYHHLHYTFLHLCPPGTPMLLMHFMVLIEMVSQMVRPLTLAIRLAANMIAGHLILVLVSSVVLHYPLMSVLGAEILLSVLEVVVAVVQAYVFCMLMSLYFSELH